MRIGNCNLYCQLINYAKRLGASSFEHLAILSNTKKSQSNMLG
jgi:hypothetical protein